MKIILASQSPRRLALLQAVGLDVVVRPSHIDETAKPEESAKAMTKRLCREKALACVAHIEEQALVVAADTLVEIDGEALGQPKELADAAAMIRQLSGRVHHVHTAVCVACGDLSVVQMETTAVEFRHVSEAELQIYLAHNDILDKAGAYAIQGGASHFIIGIDGKMDNVIGLPVSVTLALIDDIQSRITSEGIA